MKFYKKISIDIISCLLIALFVYAAVSEHFNAINTFEAPNNVKPQVFNGAIVNDQQLTASLPPLSVVALTLQP